MTPSHVSTDPKAHWIQRVAQESNAMDLDPGVFTWDDPEAIARSLKTSAENSCRRKAPPFRSAMSMLNFYINRAGSKLNADQLARLEAAKDELRALFGKPRKNPTSTSTSNADSPPDRS